MSQHDTCGFSTLAIHAGKIKDASHLSDIDL